MSSIYPLTSEQIEIQSLAREFAYREILPARNLYEKYHLDEKDTLAKGQLIEKMSHSGLFNTRIPEEFGGLGLSLVETCLIIEEIALACAGIASVAQASELAITYVLSGGSQEQKAKFLMPIAQQNQLAGIAPISCFDNQFNQQLIAEEKAGKIILNGYCSLVLNAQIAQWFILACPFTQNKTKSKNKEISYFVIANDIEGLTLSDPVEHIGCEFANARSARFKNVSLDPIAKIDFDKTDVHDKNIALRATSNIFPLMNAAIVSAGCLGLANAAFIEAKKYAQQRKTFGVPINKHQAISFMLADMNTDIEALRLMIKQSIESIKLGSSNEKLAISTQIFALEIISRITNDAVQIFGGYGYTKDYPVEKLMRDAKAYQSFFCTKNYDKEELGKSFIPLK